jgi:hypothetical protein
MAMGMPGKLDISRLLMIATLVFFAHRADALLITQSFEIESVGSSDINLFLNPFDTSLGTLTSVLLTFNAPSRISSDQFDCSVDNTFCIVRGFSSVDWLTGDPLTSRRYTTDNFGTFLPGESVPFSTMLSASLSYPPGVDLSPFTVNSPRLVVHDEWRCDDNSGGCGIGSGTQSVSGELRYSYAPVPVPATIALLVLGLVGLGVSRRDSVAP